MDRRRLAQSEAPARNVLCPAQDVSRRAHSICGCAALQTKDQDNELLVRKLKERFERCVSSPELHAAHPCPLKRMLLLLDPCHLVNRVILRACMLPDKACGQLLVGRRVDLKMPTVTVQYSSLGVNATVHVGSRALPSVWNFYRNTVEARPWPHVFTNGHACMHRILNCRPCALHRCFRWSVCIAEEKAQATPPGVKIPPHIFPRGAGLMRPWMVRAVRADWAVADEEPQAALHHPQGRQRRHQAGALPSHAP